MSQMDNEFLIDLGDPTASPAVRGLRRQELTRSSDLPFFHAAATSEAVDKLAAPQTNRERFRRKFFVVVLRTLNRACAVAGGPQRDEILTELQTHLSARIEDKVIAYFLADNSILPGNAFGNRHYYELAAEGFAERPDLFAHWNMEGIQSSLRSNDTFHAVFAMLFHQWVFVEGMAEVKSLNLLLSGAAQLFKSDLDSSAFVYRSIYQMIRKALSNHLCWNESVKARLMSLWELWARFAFFYEKQVAYVVYNFHHFQLQQLLEGAKERSTMLVVRKSDYQNPGLNSAFVRFVMDQLLAVKNERVFRRYMHFTGHVFSKMTLTAGEEN